MSQPAHVTFFSDYLSINTGGPLIMANIFEGLVKRYNYDITMVAGLVDEAFREKFENMFNIVDLKIFQPGKLPHQQPSRIPVFFKEARKTLTELQNLDILHFNSHLPNLLPYFSLPKVPRVCTIHHLEDMQSMSNLISRISLPIFQDFLETNSPCTLIHVPSKYTAEQVAKRRIFARKRIILIPNGIDLSKNLAVRKRPEPGTFLMIGRLELRKHYEHAILAAKLARKHRKDLKLYIVGDGPLRPALEQKIREENLEDAVKLLGNVDEQEKLELLARAEALIHLGYPEGFAIVVIEALATGTPVIAYDISPINEVVKNHVHGILIGKDDIRLLAGSIINFNTTRYEERILKAEAKKYDLRKVVESFHIVYKFLQMKDYDFS
jgi:glycosyltransferase involved in cell wall biosynthesis